jgi:hypothetical protein
MAFMVLSLIDVLFSVPAIVAVGFRGVLRQAASSVLVSAPDSLASRRRALSTTG